MNHIYFIFNLPKNNNIYLINILTLCFIYIRYGLYILQQNIFLWIKIWIENKYTHFICEICRNGCCSCHKYCYLKSFFGSLDLCIFRTISIVIYLSYSIVSICRIRWGFINSSKYFHVYGQQSLICVCR